MDGTSKISLRRDHLGHLSIDGKIILKWMLQKQGMRMWNWYGTVARSC